MSASPTPSAGADSKPADQIHFRFCRECSNLLYPKEDRVTNQLMFTCRTCHVGEPASSYCVYQNKLNSQVGDTAGVTQDVGSDPTVCLPETPLGFLSIPGFCACCGQEMVCETCGRSYYAVPEEEQHGTLPRANKLCPSCGENEAVFFQSQQRSAESGMKLYYVCCACGNVFM
ncbi:uncharacterized protein N7482_010409 [Penicillium canariense]|uniref:DNA-directed RNA polymerase II subunit RPB9 n=1 Tax=Penicillium canariense TaxID=189055 RepID=A0A9W9HKP6_9EURO|nr:uncharacterized protein N7482_010409 [Penicillium canariense]KAJ5151157.1 hypothetical protein N7482_010409 [Penicillium canariense]